MEHIISPKEALEVALEIENPVLLRFVQQKQQLTFAEFAAQNLARCESPKGFNHKLDSWSKSDWFVAILGELGEAANIVKKLNRERDGIRGNKEAVALLEIKLRREIGDAFVYLDLAAQACGFQLVDAAMEVFESKSREIGYNHE